MKNYVQYVKAKLMESIKSLESLKSMYVKHADKDFTRTRELTFDTMIKLILEMGGNALGYELRHYFSFDLDMPTVSAFVQRRSLTSPDAFGTIKAQTLSNQIGLVLVFIIMRWKRSDEGAFGLCTRNKKCQPPILL